MTCRRPMATPRGRQWAPEPRYTWRRHWLRGLLAIAMFLATGINDVRFG